MELNRMATDYKMGTHQSTAQQGHKQVFRSRKAPAAIFYVQRWQRDALVQLSLDPSVIAFKSASEQTSDETLRLNVETLAGRVYVAFVRDDFPVSKSVFARNEVVIKRSTVLREPRASNARAVWSARKQIVSLGDRVRVLNQLHISPCGLPLADLIACISNSSNNPVDVILSLVCQGWVILDLEKPIDPSTTVRRAPQLDPD